MTITGDDDELRALAADPETPQAALGELAFAHPELRATIALNPSTYDGLIEWLRQFDEPEIIAALAARARGLTESPDEHILYVSEPAGWSFVANATEMMHSADSVTAHVRVPDEDEDDGAPPSGSFLARFRALVRQPSVLVISGIVLVSIIGAVIIVSVTISNRNAQAEADLLAADKQNAANAANADSSSLGPTPSPTPVATTAPTPAPSPTVAAPAVGAWKFASTSGYTFTQTITFGKPVRFSESNPPENEFAAGEVAGKACQINASTDLVVPMKWEADATTKGFDTGIALNASLMATGSGVPYTLRVEQFFSGSTQCQSGTGLARLGLDFTKPMKPGTGTYQVLFVIVGNYFTPADPNGNVTALDSIVARPLTSMSAESGMSYSDVTTGAGNYFSTGIALSGKPVQ